MFIKRINLMSQTKAQIIRYFELSHINIKRATQRKKRQYGRSEYTKTDDNTYIYTHTSML